MVLSLDQTWALARAWYGDRLAAGFRGRSGAATAAIVRGVGLSSSFWSPDDR